MNIFKKTASVKRKASVLVFAIFVSSWFLLSFKKNTDFQIVKNLEVFYSLFRELMFYYVEDTDPEELIESAINGMLSSLDPYTTYIPASEKKNFSFLTTGEYGGIGAMIKNEKEWVIITEVYNSFPADKAGLKPGDIIYKIDEHRTNEKTAEQIGERLKGIPGTKLSLTLINPITRDTTVKELTREKISISSVPYYGMVNDNTGYILLTKFTQNANEEVKNAVRYLVKNHQAKAVILDLRNNPGGLLGEAVDIANIFLPKNQLIVKTSGKLEQYSFEYRTDKEPVDTAIPLVVLINEGSASASEIIAGAIQDLDRGLILGKRSFGKGLVQTTRPLSFDAQLKVTTARYYIPSGRCIQEIDYTSKDENGNRKTIPDSLIKEFKTRNGRPVFDGGGIKPDVEAEAEEFSNIALSLVTKDLIFDYATLYCFTHDSLMEFDSIFSGTSDYNDFKNFLKDKDYDYKTLSDEKLNELIKVTKEELYYDLCQSSIEELKKHLAHDKDKDLNTFRKQIIQLIKEEIASRYYYQEGRVKMLVKQDPQIQKTLEILKSPFSYKEMLKGAVTTGMK